MTLNPDDLIFFTTTNLWAEHLIRFVMFTNERTLLFQQTYLSAEGVKVIRDTSYYKIKYCISVRYIKHAIVQRTLA